MFPAFKNADLLGEFTTGATGTDCPATLAWFTAYMADTAAAHRACAHWAASPEPLKEALAAHLGFTEPSGEANPVPPAIWADYMVVATAAEVLWGEH